MDKLKEILFGFIVIAALGVIFVPMLFTDEKNSKEAVTTAPAKPVEYKLAQAESSQKTLADLKESRKQIPEHPVAKQPIQDEPQTTSTPSTPPSTPSSMTAMATPAPAPAPAPQQMPAPTMPKQEPKQEPIAEPITEPALKKEIPPVLGEEPSKLPAKPEQIKELKEPPPVPETPTEPPKPKSHANRLDTGSTEPAQPHEEAHSSALPEHETTAEVSKKKLPAKHNRAEPSIRGWVVQVGTFAVHENAVALAKKLKREGYPAYSKNVYRSGRNLTLVLVGPNSDQNAACQVRDEIENQYGLRGEVIHFAPSKFKLEEDNQ